MKADAVVIGGGFYGCSVALYLAEKRGLGNIVLLEREGELMQRASYVNQARVHCGHHYPRSFTTAYRSRVNFGRFIDDFGPAVFRDFTAVYCVARRQSKITPQQMEKFCGEVGAPLSTAPKAIQDMFNPQLIQAAYVAEERAFSSVELRRLMSKRLIEAKVDIRLGRQVDSLVQAPDEVRVGGRDADGAFALTAPMVFNCTYSGLQAVIGDGAGEQMSLKHEITELALVKPPPALAGLGVTVMDGPFFSSMPFPSRGLHSLSHVRYTPHEFWFDDGRSSPYAHLKARTPHSRADRMIRDAARYMPAIGACVWQESLFEVKTVMKKSELDDGRPILFKRHGDHGRVISILGSKIDNIYDCLEMMDREPLLLETAL